MIHLLLSYPKQVRQTIFINYTKEIMTNSSQYPIKIKRIKGCFLSSSFYFSIIIFLVSFLVRFFQWQDSRFDVLNVQSEVTEKYQLFARYLLEDGFLSFFESQSRISTDLDLMGHPPGYSYLIAFIFGIVGESNQAIQNVSIFFDSLSAVLIFLIACRFFSNKVGLIAGLLSAFSPQFALNSNFLLPDTLAIFPILLAVLFFILFIEKPNYFYLILTGISLGLSCWLRANTLLMPIFFAVAILFLIKEKRITYSATLVLSFCCIVAPITIRNAIIYKSFIPISLGSGQTLLEGIADYDTEQKFGFSRWDVGIIKKEAEIFQRPDYANTLFTPDGIARDKMRINQGWQVIRENPFWFGSVMLKRALTMLKLERMNLVSTDIPVTNSLKTNETQIKWKTLPDDLLKNGKRLSGEIFLDVSNNNLQIKTDTSSKGEQFSTPPFEVERHKDYLINIRLLITQGRLSLKLKGDFSQKIYASTDVAFEEVPDNKYYYKDVRMTFVPIKDEPVRIIFSNNVSLYPNSVLDIEKVELFELGESSLTWIWLIHQVVWAIQKLFITAIIIPLFIFGLIVLTYLRQWKTLIILLIVPLYYMSVQSALHTEYRYVMAILHFYFVFAAVFLEVATNFLKNRLFKSS